MRNILKTQDKRKISTPITRTLTTDTNLMLTQEGAYFCFEKQPNV